MTKNEAALPIKQGIDRMLRDQRAELDALEGKIDPAVLGSCRRVLNWQEAALSATAGLSTATLTALAEAGGVKRVLELLGQWNIVQEEIEWDESVPEPAVIQDTRLLLEKLGGEHGI